MVAPTRSGSGALRHCRPTRNQLEPTLPALAPQDDSHLGHQKWLHQEIEFVRLAGMLVGSAIGALALSATYAAILVALGLSDDDRTVLSRAARKVTRRRGTSVGMAKAGAPGEPT